MHYLRTRPAAQAIQFTVDQSILQKAKEANQTPRASPPVPLPVAAAPSVTSSNSYASRQGSSGVLTPISPTTISSPALSTVDETSTEVAATPATNGEKEIDPEYAAALERQKQRELEEVQLLCSIDNKAACVMCSS